MVQIECGLYRFNNFALYFDFDVFTANTFRNNLQVKCISSSMNESIRGTLEDPCKEIRSAMATYAHCTTSNTQCSFNSTNWCYKMVLCLASSSTQCCSLTCSAQYSTAVTHHYYLETCSHRHPINIHTNTAIFSKYSISFLCMCCRMLPTEANHSAVLCCSFMMAFSSVNVI